MKFYMQQLTCDNWHVICDTWHMTHHKWHMKDIFIFLVPPNSIYCFCQFLSVSVCCGIGANICTRWDIQCLPQARFCCCCCCCKFSFLFIRICRQQFWKTRSYLFQEFLPPHKRPGILSLQNGHAFSWLWKIIRFQLIFPLFSNCWETVRILKPI